MSSMKSTSTEKIFLTHLMRIDNDNDNEDEVFDETTTQFTHSPVTKNVFLHTGELYALACSPLDPTLVATGGGDDKAFLWKIGNGDWAAELPAHKDSVSSLAFSYDGQLLTCLWSLDGVVQIVDASSGTLKCVLDGPGSGIEKIVLCGCVNADKEAYLNMFSGHNQSVTCGDFTPDGHPYHTEGLICLDINSNSSLAISGSKDGSVHIVNIVTGKVVSSLSSHTESVECVKFSPSSATIPMATGGMDKKLVIWIFNTQLLGSSANTRKELRPHPYHGHQDAVQSISVSANTEFIVSVSVDHTARVYDTSEFQNKME
ncbi:hypothetical protein HID58_028197 [Brassica napus]|uniref:Uncharacterized protein n=1 Tax=Brassica napus TaxID=3708 RepID=A0ABQ7XG49_BRANA|nr:hypothetical protein HID58_028197 [Brassica napus]